MKKYILIVVFLATLIQTNLLAQQDIHSSYWDKSPTLFNPAAPILGYGKFSVFTGMRMQWLNVGSQAMRTNTALFQAKIGEGMDDGFFTIGTHFNNDQTGNGSIKTTGIAIPISYTVKLDRYRLLSLGVSPGMMNRTRNGNGTWGNQWVGTAFDQTLNSYENFAATSNFRFDLSAGLFYQQELQNRNRFYVGASVDHLIPYTNELLVDSKDELNYKYLLQSNLLLNSKNRFFSYQPGFYGSWQGGNYNFIGGVDIIYHAKERSRSLNFVEGIDFNFGIFYRYMDAIIGRFSYRNKGFEAGLSYDMTLSRFTRADKSVGAVELFLKFNFTKNNHSYDFRL